MAKKFPPCDQCDIASDEPYVVNIYVVGDVELGSFCDVCGPLVVGDYYALRAAGKAGL